MTVDAEQIARRFASLPPAQRRAFLAKLADNGIDFGELPIVALPRAGHLPLSQAQRGLWLVWQRDPKSPAYNMGGVLTVQGALDFATLQQAVGDVIARHENLRTVFISDDEGQPAQKVLDHIPSPLAFRSLAASTLEGAREESDALARLLYLAPFDLERGPLLRAELHSLPEGEQRIALVLHHIIADGWSVGLILDELSACYLARREGRPAELPPLPVQYADYTLWQRNWLDAGAQAQQLSYWKETLGEGAEPLRLPFDRLRQKDRSAAGAAHHFALPAELSVRLRGLARRHGASTFMVMLAAFSLLLARSSGEDDIRVGSPLANRGRPEAQGLIGHLTNLAVLRSRVDQRASFADLLKAVRDSVLAAEANIEVSFDTVVAALAPVRRSGVHPLFQVKFTEQVQRTETHFAGLPMTLSGLEGEEVHFDLSLDFSDNPEGIRCVFAYATDLFEAETISGLADHFLRLADLVSASPDVALAGVPSTERLLAGGATAGETAPSDVVEAWRRQAAREPDAVALCHEANRYTRGELDRASDYWALKLREAGVGRESVVALQMGRRPEWVLGILAVLKAGGAYLPLEPDLPAARREELLADSAAGWLLADGGTATFSGGKVLRLSFEEALENVDAPAVLPTPCPQQTAYLIYTSGSTGKPKAVAVTRHGLAHYTAGILRRLQLPEGARLAMVSTVAADLGNTVVFAALCGGGELHLIDPARAFDPDRFADYMAAQRIDVLKIVPSHLEALLQAGRPEAVLPAHTLVLGGEASDWPLVDRTGALAPGCRVLNHYGPTETTVGVLCQDAATANRRAASVPVGTPFASANAQVLDGYLNPVPQGVAGELYIGGPAVARGYAGRAGQTAERFVPDPFGAPGDRLYRSGDRVRRLPDGSLEFLGRMDDQVKIRGYRLEPNEVTMVLRGLAGVADAAVLPIADESGRLQLAAYVVTEGAQQLEQAKTHLASLLPDHMVPTFWLRMDALPLTSNGKLDRRALPEAAGRNEPGEPPRGGTEEALARIWSSLLGRAGIGRQDNFAALGGDSILSLKMLARIRREGLGGSAGLSLAEVLNAPTLAALAAVIAPVEKAVPDVVFLQRKGQGVPLFCIPGLIANSTEFATMVEALGGDRPVTGFVSHVFTEQRWRGYDMAALAAGYADYIESQAGEGRCALLGWSSGGDLAFETAHRLQGRVAVDFLGMVDVFESVPFLPARTLAPQEREEAGRRIEGWLEQSRMAPHWRKAFALMGPREREALEDHVLSHEGPLPLDGPEMTSREFELWAMLDKRLRAPRYTYRPLNVGIHVWQAEDSLTRPERLRDWSDVAPVLDTQVVAGACHLDIIHNRAFVYGVKAALREIDVAVAATA